MVASIVIGVWLGVCGMAVLMRAWNTREQERATKSLRPSQRPHQASAFPPSV